jgi:hypothetical protein
MADSNLVTFRKKQNSILAVNNRVKKLLKKGETTFCAEITSFNLVFQIIY